MSNKVIVLGTGQTRFGNLNGDIREIGGQAVLTALHEANIDKSEIDAAYVGNVGTPAQKQQITVGQYCLKGIGIEKISITNYENACSSSSSAFQQAYRNIKSGYHDIALVLGIEKMTGMTTKESTSAVAAGADVDLESNRGFTFAGKYGMLANAYDDAFEPSNLRETMTQISVKNHRNGSMNEYAHFQQEIDPSEVNQSRLIADPIRLYDMCPISDGAAAIIIASESAISGTTDEEISVMASSHSTGDYDASLEIAHGAVDTINEAYNQANLSPEDIDFFEIHDAATIGELVRFEALGVCDFGQGPEYILSGETQINGSYPVNPSGGLKARGHPVGATGVAQINEIVWQLDGMTGGRQVNDAEIGLALNTGGSFNGITANNTVHILGK